MRAFDSKSRENIIGHISKLNCGNESEFKSIEDYGSIQVFSEVNEEAKQTRIQIETNAISHKMNLILRFKEILNNNSMIVRKPNEEIDVAESHSQIIDTQIRYIGLGELDLWYNLETGLDLRLYLAIERRMI